MKTISQNIIIQFCYQSSCVVMKVCIKNILVEEIIYKK